jgi:hypothetical protein
MKPKSKLDCICIFAGLLLFIGLIPGPSPLLAQDVVVSAAVPDNAPQSTVNLNVQVKGNGFKKGAIAKWLVNGSEIDTGGVTVNSTAYVSATELLANITVAPNAQTLKKFDIKVTLTSGRTGKGIELFKVIYSPPDPAIAYIVGSVFNGDLTVMNADGTNRLTLIKEDRVLENSFPSWSPDGSQLVFVRDDGFYRGWLYIVNKDGSNLRQIIPLSNYAFACPQWSPEPLADGQYKILFCDQPVPGVNGDVFVVNTDGTGLVNLTNSPDEAFYPTWNPTATRFAASVSGAAPQPDIVVYDVALVDGILKATSPLNLTDAGPLKDARVSDPSWANTQDKILVSALLPGETNWNLWVIDLTDPANPVRLSQVYSSNPLMAGWAPDDSKIVYRRNAPKGSKEKSGIFIINADGTGAPGTYVVDGYWPDWRRCCPTCATVCAQ